ncbi:MAG TPA: choice-of-anchor V domain-containing protein, partial [Bacteroidota bacterium]|nr:choice-of-anchor V domain-containing protein [Bacteroidota bacterium]
MKSRFIVVVVLSIVYFILIGFDALHSTGQSGSTKKNGDGCVCHGDLTPTDSVLVWVTGPDSVELGGFAMYTLGIKGGPAVAGG